MECADETNNRPRAPRVRGADGRLPAWRRPRATLVAGILVLAAIVGLGALVLHHCTVVWRGANGTVCGVSNGKIGIAWRVAGQNVPQWPAGELLEFRVGGEATPLHDYYLNYTGLVYSVSYRSRGVSVNVAACILGAVAISCWVWAVRRSAARVTARACSQCGYNMAGLESDSRCPECGQRIASSSRMIVPDQPASSEHRE